jgi:regulator of protease activity HflC (stomatin/prohibitin superfamily)
MKTKTIFSIGFKVFIGIIIITAIFGFNNITEVNNEGHYKVKQAFYTGKMSVRYNPGMFWQNFGKITEYNKTGEIYFSKSKLDGGDNEAAAPISVRFRDGSTADISGVMKYKLPSSEVHQLKIHEDYTGSESVKMVLIRNQVIEALKQAGPHFKAEEVYAARRSEFTSLCNKQLTEGIFGVDVKEVVTFDADSNEFIDYKVNVKTNEKGSPVIEKVSPFSDYGITVLSFAIKDIDFDDKIDELIAKKKEAEQQKVVAKANAERAKQDAITAYEQGQAEIAKEKAAKEVEKIAAVTDAKKAFEVAKYEALQEKENAKKIKAKGEAEAYAARQKVAAGLTPQEAAEWKYKTSVGIAEKLASAKMPEIVVTGGEGKGGANPLTGLGIDFLMNIQERLAKKQ